MDAELDFGEIWFPDIQVSRETLARDRSNSAEAESTRCLELVLGHVLQRLFRIKLSQVMSMGKRGRENSNSDNDTEDFADADYFADDADDVSGRRSLNQMVIIILMMLMTLMMLTMFQEEVH